MILARPASAPRPRFDGTKLEMTIAPSGSSEGCKGVCTTEITGSGGVWKSGGVEAGRGARGQHDAGGLGQGEFKDTIWASPMVVQYFANRSRRSREWMRAVQQCAGGLPDVEAAQFERRHSSESSFLPQF